MVKELVTKHNKNREQYGEISSQYNAKTEKLDINII